VIQYYKKLCVPHKTHRRATGFEPLDYMISSWLAFIQIETGADFIWNAITCMRLIPICLWSVDSNGPIPGPRITHIPLGDYAFALHFWSSMKFPLRQDLTYRNSQFPLRQDLAYRISQFPLRQDLTYRISQFTLRQDLTYRISQFTLRQDLTCRICQCILWPYCLVARWVINRDNLLKFHGNLLKILGKQNRILVIFIHIFVDLLYLLIIQLKLSFWALKWRLE
jgi:hypothetical protein